MLFYYKKHWEINKSLQKLKINIDRIVKKIWKACHYNSTVQTYRIIIQNIYNGSEHCGRDDHMVAGFGNDLCNQCLSPLSL
jgi:hypothetical protein